MKKLSVIILAAIVAMSLLVITACGKTTSSSSSQPATNQTEQTNQKEGQNNENSQEAQVQPQASDPANVNPNDYWVSEDEFDLIGFMDKCGYDYNPKSAENKGTKGQRIIFINRQYGHKIYFDYVPDNSLREIDLKVRTPDKIYTAGYQTNEHGLDGRSVKFTGELQGFGSITRIYFVELIEIIPSISGNLAGGHCPFYGTIGAPFDHFEQDVDSEGNFSKEVIIHFIHSDKKDNGVCN